MIAERLKVGVIDYGMGNIASLSGRLNKIGIKLLSDFGQKNIRWSRFDYSSGRRSFPFSNGRTN